MPDTDLCWWSATELAQAVRRRHVSPVEVVDLLLRRIERLNPRLNAFLLVTADLAREQAREAERALAAGDEVGPLHGVPLAYKDLYATAGIRTTAGSLILRDWVPSEDAAAIARLRAAGAICLGKLNTVEFAYGATGANPHYGNCHNPWDTARMPGGSSSGAGAAVSTGLCYGALGSDTGGSIRIPAAFCGIVGIKPTYGRVSRVGVVTLAWSMDHVGPLARTVADAALLLQAIAGHDPRDPASSRRAVPEYRAALDQGVRGLRVGVVRRHFFDRLDPAVAAACQHALETFRGLGATVVEVDIPHLREAGPISTAMIFAEASSYHERWFPARAAEYSAEVRERLLLGRTISALDYLRAQRARRLLIEEFRAALSQADVLAAPTVAFPPPRFDEPTVDVGSRREDTALAVVQLTRPHNVAGLPTLALPVGFTPGGLPVGMQLAGRPWEEATVLRVGQAYEQATDWHRRRPPV
ncbi:MAG: amidase [Chloroflexi bacterium]|nr:amidase [Chloroflexota bacterium]